MISPQMPISDALNGTGRLYFERNFHASKRISIKLLIKANNGANLQTREIHQVHSEIVLRKSNNK